MQLLRPNRSLRLGLGFIACLAIGASAFAEQYPSRPIRFIVPTAPGGGTDILARVLGQEMSMSLGQQVVVDNRPGAGSTIGTTIASKATPDGHTLLIVTPSFAINPSLRRGLPYDSLKEFSPVSLLASVPNILLVEPSLPVKSAQNLVALVRAAPGKYNYASGGYGTPPHLAMELFKVQGGFNITHVAYKGSGPALLALMTKQVSFMINGAPPALPYIKGGRLRPLAVTSPQRWKEMPELPTVSESVLPGYEALTWFGLLVPSGTPAAIIKRLNTVVQKTLSDPAVARNLQNQGFIINGSNPGAFRDRIMKDMEMYKAVVQRARLEVL